MPVQALSPKCNRLPTAPSEDPDLLVEHFHETQALLGVLANRIEPRRELAEKAHAEALRLQEAQAEIVICLADRPALDAADVPRKPRLWRAERALDARAEILDFEDRLVLSAIADLEDLARPAVQAMVRTS